MVFVNDRKYIFLSELQFIIIQSSQTIYKLQSCKSSNPGYPDSDKRIYLYYSQKIYKLQSCTSSNPGYPDSDNHNKQYINRAKLNLPIF
jgi:hypothetical protein